MGPVSPSAVGRRPLLLAGVAALAAAAAGCGSGRPTGRDATRPTGPFWVDPDSEAAHEAAHDPALSVIADQPTALTVTGTRGDMLQRVTAAAGQAHTAGQTLLLQVYDIPHRDIGGGYSAGGAPNADAYLRQTRLIARALAGKPTVLVLEPDSLGQLDALSPADQATRYRLLNTAVDVYRAVPGVVVYLDGTNSGWLPAPEMARRLLSAGVARTQGFAVNVSNFYPTSDEADRAEQISSRTGGSHYVVDTSRNGGSVLQGHRSSWCNPPDRRLGQRPTTHTDHPHADAYLWLKHPGESDGDCAPGQPPAGQWYPSYARGLLGLPPS